MRPTVLTAILVAITATLAAVPGAVTAATPTNVDVSQRLGNESEEAIAVNPTNPNNIVVFTNVGHAESGLTAGMFLAVSFDGGITWTKRLVGLGPDDTLGDSCCDPSLSFDQYGNLFMTYLYQTENTVPVALSTDGGLTFTIVTKIVAPPKGTPTKAAGDGRGLFRFVDQPTITAGRGEVWVTFNAGGPMFATGAPVTGLGQVGAFSTGEVVPGTNNCTYGDISIGPGRPGDSGLHLDRERTRRRETLRQPRSGRPRTGGLRQPRLRHRDTRRRIRLHPPQPNRSVDAEPGLAWGSAHGGRLYLVYTAEVKNESDNTDVFVRHSDDGGTTWSDPLRVNDDRTTTSQFLPKVSLDPTTGNLAVIWYDSRADLGLGGAGDTDGVFDDDAQLWGAFSTDGGASFEPNIQISAGTSNSDDSGNGIDYGDYSGLSFYGGVAHPAWSDNSNSTGTNPNGALSKLDIYTAAVRP